MTPHPSRFAAHHPGPSGLASAENQPKGRFSGRFGPPKGKASKRLPLEGRLSPKVTDEVF